MSQTCSRWLIRYDRQFKVWVAMPWDRMWVIATVPWTVGKVMGPIGIRWFESYTDALAYTHDDHQPYLDGWMA